MTKLRNQYNYRKQLKLQLVLDSKRAMELQELLDDLNELQDRLNVDDIRLVEGARRKIAALHDTLWAYEAAKYRNSR